jgi:hypothetical protein
MQGVLYFPFIGVPDTAWWTRTMLYWDNVATIVPRSYIRRPELHTSYTRELISAELLHQVLPDEAVSLERNFSKYLGRLSGREIDRRRRGFSMGYVTRVHTDKWISYASGLREIERLGLAVRDAPEARGDWALVEADTAAEFMAALALSLCESVGTQGWRYSDRNGTEKWVPATDTPPAIRALMAGLEPLPSTAIRGDRVHVRIRGEIQAAEIRTHLMEMLLPVPESAVPPERIARFRKTHGHRLPEFRRYLETKIDESLMIPDPVLRARFMERIEDEVAERTNDAAAYLRELGLQRIGRSSLLRVLKFIPGVEGPIGTAQELAENLRTDHGIESHPLAYLAFARAAFAPSQNYRIDPLTGMPLIEAIQSNLN